MNYSLEKIIWYVPLELNHSSYIYTAVCYFCRKYDVKLEISSRNLNKKGRINIQNVYQKDNKYFEKVCYVRIFRKDNTSFLAAFDSYDLPYQLSTHAYEIADFVFKRSYQERYINKLPKEYRLKTYKFGLPFMVRPNKLDQPIKYKFYYKLFNLQRHLKADRKILQRFKRSVNYSKSTWSFFIKTRTVEEFEERNKIEERRVFYQKRLFSHENSKDVKAIHQQRIKIVGFLKEQFPYLFIGGIKKDDFSVNRCPDSLSNISSQKEFLEAFKKIEICIYTRGLTNSTGWTLSEFLAQGKCIVAEELYNELPVPLKNEEQVYFFNSEEELKENIDLLLSDKNKRTKLKSKALEYYNDCVTPRTFLENLINRI